jgi:hypothetical protein
MQRETPLSGISVFPLMMKTKKLSSELDIPLNRRIRAKVEAALYNVHETYKKKTAEYRYETKTFILEILFHFGVVQRRVTACGSSYYSRDSQ